ncbi:zinc resistance-associated protein [Escherichia albertii]|nr:zinc resistance-associated protein [Escherichia albertii]EFO4721273.1 zinc resistance-associated protein [Escherichia albertii]
MASHFYSLAATESPSDLFFLVGTENANTRRKQPHEDES